MYDYILDGTNICHTGSSQGPSLIPVFQIVRQLVQAGHSFICFFDGNTFRDHLTDDLEKATYAAITQRYNHPISLFAQGCFLQVKDIKADAEVLARAQADEQAYVISSDRFDEPRYQQQYGWDQNQRNARLLTVHAHKGLLSLVKPLEAVHMEIAPAEDPSSLIEEVLNLVEASQHRLQGRIMNLQMGLRIGQIERRYGGGKRLMFHQTGISDPDLSFAQSRGQEVSFRITPYHNVSGNKSKWEFQAHDIRIRPSLEEERDQLSQENQELHRVLDITDQKKRLAEEQQATLAAELEALKAHDAPKEERIHELVQENAQLQAEVSRLLAEVERLQALLRTQEQERQSLALTIGWLETEQQNLSQELVALQEGQQDVELGPLQEAYTSLQVDYQQLRQLLLKEKARGHVFRRMNTEGTSADLEAELARLQQEVASLRSENQMLRQQVQAQAEEEQPNASGTTPPPPEVAPGMENAPLSDAQKAWWYGFSADLRAYFLFKYRVDQPEPNGAVLRGLFEEDSLNLSGPRNELERQDQVPVIKDLSGIGQLSRLRVLNLSFHEIDSLQDLLALPELRVLFLDHNRLCSLAGIERLAKLEELFVAHNALTDIHGVQQLSCLTDLNVRDNPGLSAEQIAQLDISQMHPDLLIRQ